MDITGQNRNIPLPPSPLSYKDKKFGTGKFSKINVNNLKMNISLRYIIYEY